MIYCINPECSHRQNAEQAKVCSSCGTPLLISGRLRLIKPLRDLDVHHFIEVFEVEDLGVKKVLKVLTRNTPSLVEQFEREAICLQLLSHEGIPKVDFDGYFTVTLLNSMSLHCLVMEYLDGQNLEDWLKVHGKISQVLALNWMRQILAILEYIHAQGYFHRDLKPSNIICRPDGRLALIDFGSVRAISNTYLITIGQGEATTAIISQGYSPPEQINGQALPQSDFYALGRTFVHLLTGISPFQLSQDAKNGRLLWHQYAKQISRPFAEYIDDLMAISPGERPQTSKVILQHLTENRLFFESVLRRFGSRQFRFRATRILTIAMVGIVTGFTLYQLALIKRAELHWQNAQDAIQVQDWDVAVQKLEKAVSLMPNEVLYQEKLANAYWKQGRKFLTAASSLQKARNNFEKAVQLIPDNANYHHDLGIVCAYQTDYSCAIAHYKKALQLPFAPENKAYTHYSLGSAYEDIKQFQLALEQYKIAMQYPDIIGVVATNAFVRLQILRNQNPSSVIPYLLEALERSQTLSENLPEDSDKREQEKEGIKIAKAISYRNLGWTYLLQGDYLQAEDYLLQAIELENSEQALSYCLLAKVKQHLNPQNVLPAWENCLKLEGDPIQHPELEVWRLDALEYVNRQRKLL